MKKKKFLFIIYDKMTKKLKYIFIQSLIIPFLF